MHIAYYITGHGYGHASRAVTIANNFSPTTKVTFKTSIPESFFKREMNREYYYHFVEFDCGCLQYNSITVDIAATLKYYSTLALRNERYGHDEVVSCKKNKIDGIVSDIPPFVFDVAASLDVPAIAITNFTWYDIYNEYISTNPWFTPFLTEMKYQYQKADLALALSPALPMNYFSKLLSVPIVGRFGKNVRYELSNLYGIDEKAKKIGLIYIGDFGLAEAQWSQMDFFSDWEFIGLHDIPGHPRNYHTINLSHLPYPDIIKSSDCVIGKLGYGVGSECMINATPLVFLPRENFAEFPVLQKAVMRWGGAKMLSVDDFMQLDWKNALDTLPDKNNLLPEAGNGAQCCAEIIERYIADTMKV